MEKRHRIFIAINLPEDVKKQLASYLKKWPDLPAKWTERNSIHITVEFLGHLTDEEMADACLATKEVAARHNSFSINLSKILYGPVGKIPPKMVWAEGEKSEELSLLREDLENSLAEKVRFIPENRVFAPHITLARIKEWEWRSIEPEERPEIEEGIDLAFTVESIEVMESELKRNGPEYTVLDSFELNS